MRKADTGSIIGQYPPRFWSWAPIIRSIYQSIREGHCTCIDSRGPNPARRRQLLLYEGLCQGCIALHYFFRSLAVCGRNTGRDRVGHHFSAFCDLAPNGAFRRIKLIKTAGFHSVYDPFVKSISRTFASVKRFWPDIRDLLGCPSKIVGIQYLAGILFPISIP